MNIDKLKDVYESIKPCTKYEQECIKGIVDDLYSYTSDNGIKDKAVSLINRMDIILGWDFNKLYPVSRQALSKVMHQIYGALSHRNDGDVYSICRLIIWEDFDTIRRFNDIMSRSPKEYKPTINCMILIRKMFLSIAFGNNCMEGAIMEDRDEREVSEFVDTIEINKVKSIEVSNEAFNEAKDMINSIIFNECDIMIYRDLSSMLFHMNRFVLTGSIDDLDRFIESIAHILAWSFKDLNKQLKTAKEGLLKIFKSFPEYVNMDILAVSKTCNDIENDFYRGISINKSYNISESDIREHSMFLRLVISSLQYFKQLKRQITSGDVKVIYV